MQSKIIEGERRRGTSERNNLIRAYVKTGRTQASLAREYGISPAAINKIVHRKDSQPEEKRGFWRRIWKTVRRK